MEENFDVDKFISLVKTKESIWNYKSQAYGNKTQRRDDWMSICEAMIEDFSSKSNSERSATVIEFQSKWKVLRDGFTRSIKNYKKKNSKDGSKGKLYAFYTQLQFLNDLYADKGLSIISDLETSIPSKEAVTYKARKRHRKMVSETSSEDNDSTPQSEKPNNSDINKASRNTNDIEFDEDKQFLLSLLSDFRKIPSDQKLDAKGDIINVIRHYRSTSLPQFQTRGSYYSNDIAALATTATDRPISCGSNYFEHTENSCDNVPTEIKFITHS